MVSYEDYKRRSRSRSLSGSTQFSTFAQIFGSHSVDRTSGLNFPSSFSLSESLDASRRTSLQDDLIDLFSGGRAPTGTPPIIPRSGGSFGSSNSGQLFDLFANIFGSIFSHGSRSHTSSTESSRSVEERQRWSLSRSQQQASLAQAAQQGARNL